MKIYSRKEFLSLPDGTFFSKGVQWCFDGLCMKIETWGNDKSSYRDFLYVHLVDIESESGEDRCDLMEEMLKNGKSCELRESIDRDGVFDDDDVFLIYEKKDLLKIKNLIEEFLNK